MITGLVLFPYVAAEQAAFPALGVSEQVRPEAQGERLPMPLEQVTRRVEVAQNLPAAMGHLMDWEGAS